MASAFNFYNVAVVQMKDITTSLTNILDKAQASAVASDLPKSRIAEDMRPLLFQVANIGDLVEKFVSAIEGKKPTPTDYEMNNTWDGMRERLAAMTARIEGVTAEQANQAMDNPVDVEIGEIKGQPKIADYYFHFVFPNTYFHLITAYNICRKDGVDLGKRDYIMPHVVRLLA